MEKLSVTILTKNEDRQIRNCLESVRWADEIVIIDDESSDRTLEICRAYTDRIFIRKMSDGFSKQRAYSFQQAGGDWILIMDADQTVSEGLKEEILGILKNGSDCDGFRIPRPTSYLGKWIRYCGWRPEVLLLFRKNKAIMNGKMVHEDVVVKGKIGRLRNEILHHNYASLSEHFRRMELYTLYDAEELWKRKARLYPWNYCVYFILKPAFVFFRKYVVMQGFREGARGLFISMVTAFVVFMNYARLWEIQYIQKRKDD